MNTVEWALFRIVELWQRPPLHPREALKDRGKKLCNLRTSVPHYKYDIKGEQTKRILNLSFEGALTYGDWDINENWMKYKEEFLKGVKDE
jgi:hypothetical protein